MTTNPIVRAQTCASLQLSTFQCQYRGGQGLRCKVVFSAIAEVANWPLQGLSYCCCLQLCTSGTTTMSRPQGQKVECSFKVLARQKDRHMQQLAAPTCTCTDAPCAVPSCCWPALVQLPASRPARRYLFGPCLVLP